ncbi:MAG TPA: hypothetical protein DEF18_02860 [Muricauda sp.]|nr:hypothetical protein [uncultured Allomuricauda sp.]MBC73321.1 hypothetical protein [Allomuricauda sp.]HBU77019.1 hypothetical protein [Allomuricauda sp.]|tara:strand:- start:1067 stop:2143 length:1077 start_codon:yes stop_codon:yes gene_type:complete
MTKNYEKLIQRVKERSNPSAIDESVLLEKSFSAELRNLYDRKVLVYIKRAMQGVEPIYTRNTFEAGNKVKSHLKNAYPNLDYEYQGSVPSNTHIKGYSDIDLVQISGSFYSHENMSVFTNASLRTDLDYYQRTRLNEVINATPYLGDANENLKKIRQDAEELLAKVYKGVNSDKAKSIEVNVTSPKRMVDVVTASWYKSIDAVVNGNEYLKGIQIYDKKKNIRLKVDFPFLKIHLLNDKDSEVNGRLKKMVRFLKTLKADSNVEIDFSSFDISSVCYNIDKIKYFDKSYDELVHVLFEELSKIAMDSVYRDSIRSIDDTEYIFKNNPEKITQLRLLLNELDAILKDMLKDSLVKRFLL